MSPASVPGASNVATANASPPPAESPDNITGLPSFSTASRTAAPSWMAAGNGCSGASA